MKGAELVVEALKRNNVKFIFGIPGDTKDENGVVSEAFLFQELAREEKFVTVVHEQNAAFMADLYGRVSGNAGVCYSTLGPGATNLATGVANAFQDHSPVVAISAQLPVSRHDKDVHQYVDMGALFDPITKDRVVIRTPEEVSSVSRAFAVAESPRQGPVHLELRVDILGKEAKGKVSIPSGEAERPGVSDITPEIMGAIQSSKSPLIFIGASAARTGSSEEIVKLAEKLGVPVLTSFNAKGEFPPDHPLHIGVASRYVEAVREVFDRADLLINVGYDYTEGIEPPVWGEGKRVLHIDNAPPTGPRHYQPDLTVVSDIPGYLAKLSEAYGGCKKWDERVIAEMKEPRTEDSVSVLEGFCDPKQIVRSTRRVLDLDDILVCDVGLHKQHVGLGYEAHKPGTLFFSNGLSSMGFGLPGAIGAKFAAPDRNVVTICGDGCFTMSSAELRTAVRHDVPITVVVFNDSRLGMIHYAQRRTTGEAYAVDFVNPDFVKLAECYGARGMRVERPSDFEEVFREAVSSDKPTVVDVPIVYGEEI